MKFNNGSVFKKIILFLSTSKGKIVVALFVAFLFTITAFGFFAFSKIKKDNFAQNKDNQENIQQGVSSDTKDESVVENPEENTVVKEDLLNKEDGTLQNVEEVANKDKETEEKDKDEEEDKIVDEDEEENDEDEDDDNENDDEKDDEDEEAVSKYSEEECIKQKKEIAKEADDFYLDWYDGKLEAKKEVSDCYDENPVPICDEEMSDFNVEWQEKLNDEMKDLQAELTKCSPDDRQFSEYCETPVPSNY